MTINSMNVRDALQRANQAGRGSLSDLETLLKALSEGAVYDTYAGNPTSNLTPKAKGSWCLDTSSNIWYRAKDITNTDWVAIGEHGLTQAELTVLNVVAGTAAVSKALVLDSDGNILMPAAGVFGLSRAALAAAGGNQAAAAVITTQIAAVTGADDAKGVALPAAAVTEGPILIINTDETNLLLVYPVNSGDDAINALSANAAFTMGPGKAAWFIPTGAAQWYCAKGADEGTLTTGFGSGITVAAAVFKSSVERVGGIITTRILIDISDLESEAADKDIIGDDGAANCHLGKITAAQNGTIFAGTVKCLEIPTTGEPDINLYAATASDGTEGADVTALAGQAILVDVNADWTLGLEKVLTAMPATNTYLYFAVGTSSTPDAGTYGAGKFLIELLGYDA